MVVNSQLSGVLSSIARSSYRLCENALCDRRVLVRFPQVPPNRSQVVSDEESVGLALVSSSRSLG
ncbi:hypothetical protein IQ270_04050 [Microcoleus sp. LEGE 07076]|uniref:hypothetical protein n=1 Tax=Microcoleus sp. LEGE 07076 TaxID=915322 RepID=UPI00187ECAC9|nr:hypothetical protein [Microcoleus sp. LEGE 07076]MBE9183917.1 hypothetical protein [Microcoleus sp. LEGE 07076]